MLNDKLVESADQRGGAVPWKFNAIVARLRVDYRNDLLGRKLYHLVQAIVGVIRFIVEDWNHDAIPLIG